MSEIIIPTIYFDKPGKENTLRTLEIAKKRAEELKVKNIVVATTSGETGIKAAELFKGYNLIVVTHSTGFTRPDFQEFTEENRKKIEKAGAKILTCQHAFGGIGRAVRKKLRTYELEEIIAYTLRIFGEGTKVAIEISLMAADAGLIRTDEPCIALGGTSWGVDTAIVLRPANAQTFFDIRIMEILCKPHF
ncbi:MAG: pyruvate kinase alpha/beta domain-containing protein [Candidatus Aminicenantia bacterium]